jgi:hypothetical protein
MLSYRLHLFEWNLPSLLFSGAMKQSTVETEKQIELGDKCEYYILKFWLSHGEHISDSIFSCFSHFSNKRINFVTFCDKMFVK